MSQKETQFSLQDVANYDGREGRSAYIVFEDTVYDVSASSLWAGGSHMNRHQAGSDLTDQLTSAPHFAEVFNQDNVKKVGVLKPEEHSSEDLPNFLKTLFRYVPMLRRHPHPISVHFPTAYLTTAFLFLLIDYFLGNIAGINFNLFAFVLLILGFVTTAASVGTGYLTLWVNYRLKKPKLVRWKINLALTLLGGGALAIIIKSSGLTSLAFFGWVYNLLILLLALLVMGLGHLGGQMVFPTSKSGLNN